MKNYHEKEIVVLQSERPQRRKLLHKHLRARGFKSEDDFYELFRKGKCEPWQSTAVLTLSVFQSGATIYETEEDIAESGGTTWDELHCEYLLATLPRECIELMLNELSVLCTCFDLRMAYDGQAIEVEDLRSKLNSIADNLAKTLDEPGSEALRILIQQQY